MSGPSVPARRSREMDRSTWLGRVTVGQVEDLRAEAATAGDEAMCQICDDACEGDVSAQDEVARVIANAEAQS